MKQFPTAPKKINCKICGNRVPNPIVQREPSSVIVSTCQDCRDSLVAGYWAKSSLRRKKRRKK